MNLLLSPGNLEKKMVWFKKTVFPEESGFDEKISTSSNYNTYFKTEMV